MQSSSELANLLDSFETESSSGNVSNDSIINFCTKVAELVEREVAAYLKMDPDPFDGRHPGRVNPNCTLGQLLKILLKNDDLVNKLINDFLLNRENKELNVVAARLLLDLIPFLESTEVFQDRDGLIERLFQWVENDVSPLRAYATGLLGPAMDIPDVAANFREKNAHLVPLLLKRLKTLAKESEDENTFYRPFAHLSNKSKDDGTSSESCYAQKRGISDFDSVSNSLPHQNTGFSPQLVPTKITEPNIKPFQPNECSGSSWQEVEQYVIGPLQMYPLTLKMEQRFILQYLTPMGEYQELLSHVFEHNALVQVLNYSDLRKNSVRLAFESLKYLAALLCHKKVAIEFINMGGLQHLLRVPRPSLAATGVSVCLYYLAYSEDAMEWVCMLSRPILYDLVKYVLWLLECSHESSRCHATMFFGLTFPFKVIHELFDEQDGLRKLVNVISTLEILDGSTSLGEDAVFAERQQARHVLVALKKYYETHLAIFADQLRRAHSRNQEGSPHTPQLSKNVKFDSALVNENIATVVEFMPPKMRWKPVDEFHRLGTVSLLIHIIYASTQWTFSGRVETVKSALDVLNVTTVVPRTQISLTEQIANAEVGMGVILAAAEGQVVSDPEVVKSAINVIINCVCGPESKNATISLRSISGSSRKKGISKHEDLLYKMWDCVRSNNGIMVLLNILEIKTPITDADSIRALACRALVGLVRSDTVRQIVGKLPLFINGMLQVLMQEPVLQDKRQEHVKFCKHAVKLIEAVTGKPLATRGVESIDKIHKADVVAQTKIIYKDKDLLHLINQHLMSKGLVETACVLMQEASLKDKQIYKSTNTSCNSNIYSSPVICRNPKFQSPSLLSGRGISTPRRLNISSSSSSSPSQLKSNHSISTCKAGETSSNSISCQQLMSQPGANSSDSSSRPADHSLSQVVPSNSHGPPTHVKINLTKLRGEKIKHKLSKNKTDLSRSTLNGSTSLLKQSPFHRNPSSPLTSTSIGTSVTLDCIVTEYLRKQHSLCINPVVTCPPFDLFQPHRCPEPIFRNTAPYNISARISRRSYFPRYGGPQGRNLDMKHMYSRFRPAKTYKDDQSSSYSCCAFSACDQYIIVGTVNGELKFYNILTGQEEKSFNCHDTEMVRCEQSKDETLFLTSTTWGRPLGALWRKTENSLDMKHPFEDDLYAEFSKLAQDRIVGTTIKEANIYDVGTGQRLAQLKDPQFSNHYTKNRATFSPTDEFVLSDGILWDSHNSLLIHKFDKFNSHINGVFHPNGLEIISNSQVWDIRTFHLLKTVPALDQCRITFSHHGDVIYGAIMEDDVELDEDEVRSPFGSSFRTFSAHDYSNIATIDTKRTIYDLCTNKYDTYLAILENQGDGIADIETTCRLYEIGRIKDSDDEEMEEDEEEEDESDDDDEDEDEDDEIDIFNEDDTNDNESGNSGSSDGSELSSSWVDDDDGDDEDDEEIRFALA